MDVSDAKRLRALEDENRKVKKLLAEPMLDQAALKELLTKNGRPRRKREAVAHLRNIRQMSERRACTLVAADRKTIRYQSRRPLETELGKGSCRKLALHRARATDAERLRRVLQWPHAR
jgi:hypothetical protein